MADEDYDELLTSDVLDTSYLPDTSIACDTLEQRITYDAAADEEPLEYTEEEDLVVDGIGTMKPQPSTVPDTSLAQLNLHPIHTDVAGTVEDTGSTPKSILRQKYRVDKAAASITSKNVSFRSVSQSTGSSPLESQAEPK